MSKKVNSIKGVRARQEVPEGDTWDLSLIFSNETLWENALASLKKEVPKLSAFRGTLSSKNKVLACLKLMHSLECNFEEIDEYANLRHFEDLSNSSAKSRLGKVEEFEPIFLEAAAFFDPELSQQEESFILEMIEDPEFSEYRLLLKNILRMKTHLLSLPEEELLARMEEIFGSTQKIYESFSDSDLLFKQVKKEKKLIPLTHGNYGQLIRDSQREVRQQTMENTFKAYHTFRTTLAQSLASQIKEVVVNARIRKYNSTIESLNYGNAIPERVYEALFKVTNESLPLLHRYCKIRKKILAVDPMYWYDLYVPLIKGTNRQYSYNQAVAMVLESLEPMGESYLEMAKRALIKERWVDKYENKSKMSGAYSFFGGYNKPSYILMNFNGTLDNVFALAHEWGHSAHSSLSKNNQPYPTYHYPIFLAEIASTFNENLLTHSLMAKADEKMRTLLIDQELENIRLTFFRQTMFAEFDRLLYESSENGIVLTADFLEDEYFKINQRYHGNEVVIDPLVKVEWSRIPHFYYDFYVYQYATGLACSSYFAQKVLSGNSAELQNYLQLISSGGSDYPVQLLIKAGLDVTTDQYLKMLMARFESLMDEFEELTA